ncbi:hypothetical protein NEOLEDRAFT_1174647 [Neolentinus lepideus HHB14362 ss-1]|uniref:Uncharacterized protein n=1 Tax=Neolentinus lepideus HHB14362 ss-1 TaxID=1314782 RepID=A0A165VFN9_9AGAM|nr:hypothetical protein NEOLEDRAFT_1174647 [Neolentinus lepideus HHB14362 ss-1]
MRHCRYPECSGKLVPRHVKQKHEGEWSAAQSRAALGGRGKGFKASLLPRFRGRGRGRGNPQASSIVHTAPEASSSSTCNVMTTAFFSQPRAPGLYSNPQAPNDYMPMDDFTGVDALGKTDPRPVHVNDDVEMDTHLHPLEHICASINGNSMQPATDLSLIGETPFITARHDSSSQLPPSATASVTLDGRTSPTGEPGREHPPADG